MATKNLNLGIVPVSRGEFNSTTMYYKDNIVQYKRGSYQVVSESPIIGISPTNDKNVVNPGWTLFAGAVDAQDVSSNTEGLEGSNVQANLNDASNKLSELEKEVIYDVTANNEGATFPSLSALLSSENLSTLIPSTVRCGGMSIRFIRSSDNKYVQYRLMNQNWSTVVTDWQGSDTTIIYALPAIYVKAPSQDIGTDGDYVLLMIENNHRIYRKDNGVWNRFDDYDKVLVYAGNRVFYKKSNDETVLFIEITTPIIDFEVLSEGIPSQSANEGDYTLSLNSDGANSKRLYIYNNAKWEKVYDYSHFISPIFRNGNAFYKILYSGSGFEISDIVKIIDSSVVDALQKELYYSTIFEKLVATTSGVMIGTAASDKNFYLKVTPLTTYTLRFKAQYTGSLALYASTDGNDLIGLLFEVKDTDFTSEYVATITTPDNCNIIRTRTYLDGAVIDYISLYSVTPLNVAVKDIEEKQKANQSDWTRKVISTYGDSVIALNGGDFNYPYDESTFGDKWALRVANYFNASSVKNRGIGGQRFSWRNDGGSISWVNTLTGEYVNRNDSYNYDNYEGNVEIPSGCTLLEGLSSWLRITSMYPESIKDTIDVILVMAHNDAGLDTTTEVQFLTGDNTDPEWANSTYYQTYNGDYNINTVRGGIASTIMKLQAWMPNAVIVLMTPISGRGTKGELNPELTSSMTKIADVVKEMHSLMSIPCIDVYGTCGINGLNRTLYITDTIHPYSVGGSKMVARAVIGGLKSIIPNM